MVSVRRAAVVLGVALSCGLSACGVSSPGAGSAGAGSAGAGSPTSAGAATRAARIGSATATSTAPAATGATSTTPAGRRRPRRRPAAIPDVGRLPQTEQVPSAGTPVFHAEMRDLWSAVRSGSVTPGLPAFFPEAAYVQLKSIGSPQSDWEYRLVGDYRLDIEAAHALLGADAAGARLAGVQVPGGYAHRIPPGVCDNGIGYYELPNARVVYRAGGETRSFGIASMISWHGLWFIVHLGAILRPAGGGMLDTPSLGPGVSEPSSAC